MVNRLQAIRLQMADTASTMDRREAIDRTIDNLRARLAETPPAHELAAAQASLAELKQVVRGEKG